MKAQRRTWTREEAIDAVRAFAARHGYQPVSDEAGPFHGLPSFNTAARIFGGWNALIEAAGLTPYPARSSGEAKTRAFRDRNPDWRERRMEGVTLSLAGTGTEETD